MPYAGASPRTPVALRGSLGASKINVLKPTLVWFRLGVRVWNKIIQPTVLIVSLVVLSVLEKS
jgi:hypothetical protein